MSCLKEVALIDLSFLKDTVLRTGAGLAAHALNVTAKWSRDTLPILSEIPGSMGLFHWQMLISNFYFRLQKNK